MSHPPARLIIGYGSETGNCRNMARELAEEPALRPFAPEVRALNDLPDAVFRGPCTLVIITSSYGEGGPPDNAYVFWERLHANDYLPDLRYAIYGLGDTAYAQFCGFPRTLDTMLDDRQAESIVNRVDADLDHADYFEQWKKVLVQVLQGDRDAGKRLDLRVVPDGENEVFAAPVLQRRPLSTNPDEAPAWHIRLGALGSSLSWQAGDTLFVIPENDPALLSAIADWYGDPEVVEKLQDKELRLLSKGLLRDLAGLSGNRELRALLRPDQAEALEAYLRHADLLDVLQDFCEPARVPVIALQTILGTCEPRAYSIASPEQADYIDLCVRELRYEHQGREHRGTATRWLLHHDGRVHVYCRPNETFRLTDAAHPLILIGTGTGVAPLIGLLREMRSRGVVRETCLIFGEKTRAHDFLYQDELESLQREGVLDTLLTAFSRDADQKRYVQHVIVEQAGLLRGLLARDAHIYLCGNKRHLEEAVSTAIDTIMAGDAGSAESAAGSPGGWRTLSRQGRIHMELY